MMDRTDATTPSLEVSEPSIIDRLLNAIDRATFTNDSLRGLAGFIGVSTVYDQHPVLEVSSLTLGETARYIEEVSRENRDILVSIRKAIGL